jgi:Fe-Mn family superoxide dismutase
MSIPILALDMWEHAYYSDFGLDKGAYVDWYLSHLDWRNPRKRIKNILRMK